MRLTKYKTKLTDEGKAVLTKEISVNCQDIDNLLNSPEKVDRVARDFLHIHEETEEYVYLLCLNNKNVMTSIFELSHGTVNSSMFGIRELFQKALLANAVGIIIIHNHPSGDPKPSPEDKNITKRIKDAGDMIGIMILDHVIIGNRYFSLREAGMV